MLGKIQVEFIKGWQNYKPGDRINPPAMLREWLMQNGFVKPIDDSKVTDKLSTRKKKPVTRKKVRRKK